MAPHLQDLANLAARLAGEADRDDLVQEALTRAWRRRATFDPARGTARAWLLAIVADQARQRWRRLSRRRPPLPTGLRAEPDDAQEPGPTMASHAAARLDVEAAVARLPRRQRLAVDLFYFVGLSVAETAAVMRCSPGTVKSTLADARARLKKLLDVEDDDGR